MLLFGSNYQSKTDTLPLLPPLIHNIKFSNFIVDRFLGGRSNRNPECLFLPRSFLYQLRNNLTVLGFVDSNIFSFLTLREAPQNLPTHRSYISLLLLSFSRLTTALIGKKSIAAWRLNLLMLLLSVARTYLLAQILVCGDVHYHKSQEWN